MYGLVEQVKNIETYVNRITPIDHQQVVDFAGNARVKTFKKNEHSLREGEQCAQLLFVHQGTFRYYITKNGKDFTKDFCLDSTNPFCTGFTSFVTQTASLINIEALEDSLVSVWNESYVKELFKNLPWLVFARKIAELLFVRKEKLEISLLRDSAEERYKIFVKELKDVMQKVPQYHIASYLGITPESLSRIRMSIAKRS